MTWFVQTVCPISDVHLHFNEHREWSQSLAVLGGVCLRSRLSSLGFVSSRGESGSIASFFVFLCKIVWTSVSILLFPRLRNSARKLEDSIAFTRHCWTVSVQCPVLHWLSLLFQRIPPTSSRHGSKNSRRCVDGHSADWVEFKSEWSPEGAPLRVGHCSSRSIVPNCVLAHQRLAPRRVFSVRSESLSVFSSPVCFPYPDSCSQMNERLK